MPLLDRTTDTAAAIGSVNFILRDGDALVGENTEGKGAVEAIRAAVDPAGKQVVLLGAGQVGGAVAVEIGRRPAGRADDRQPHRGSGRRTGRAADREVQPAGLGCCPGAAITPCRRMWTS